MAGLGFGFGPLKEPERPPMKQEDHPVHDMPKPEHNGDNLPVNSPAVSSGDEQ